MGNNIYILVADSALAKVFSTTRPLQGLQLVRHFEHDESRQKNSATYTDRPGRQQSDIGGSHSFAGDLQTHETEKFARILGGFLDKELAGKKFDELVMVATPRLLGELRQHLGKDSSRHLLATVDRDIVHMPEQEIAGHLRQYVPGLAEAK
jgi:protein required for attachment to host cells